VEGSCELDDFSSGQGSVAAFCEDGNELTGSIERQEFS
jgi:hypothetical protein